MCDIDLSEIDLDDVLLQTPPHLAGIYKPGERCVPGSDPVRTKYNSKTKFPEGFNRYDEMEKVD